MAEKSMKLKLLPYEGADPDRRYLVVETRNTVEPHVGERLTDEEVDEYHALNGIDYTIVSS